MSICTLKRNFVGFVNTMKFTSFISSCWIWTFKLKQSYTRCSLVQLMKLNFSKKFFSQKWITFKKFSYKCLKRSLTFKKIICFNENSLKIMKNAFYFILKALSILMIFKFVLTFCWCRENGLIRKIRLISNFMTSQHG